LGQFSRQFLGTQIGKMNAMSETEYMLILSTDAVYHTSIVLEGIEYFYGAGVQTAYAGSTHHGQPMEKIKLGRTNLPIGIVLEYLESLKQIYTMEAYDLFLHNCNNFSNDFAMFLVGKGIPEHITSLPQTVLNTPFGQMLKPQLDAAMRPITQAPVPPPQQPFSTATTSASTLGRVHNVASLSELRTLLDSASKSCAVVFFTSSTCAPCKVCYPAYDELAAEAGTKATLIKVDINFAQAIAAQYSVRATPTFMTFLRGKKEDQWSGADANRLRGTVRLLLESAHPSHPHHQLKLPKLLSTSLRSITYTKVPPLEKVIAKLGPLGKEPIVPGVKKFIEATHGKNVPQDSPVPSLPAFGSLLENCQRSLPISDLFAAYDLFRLAVADTRVSAFFAEERNTVTILRLLKHVNALGDEAPYSLRIVSLHVACNLFASPLASHVILAKDDVVKELIILLTSSLLDETHNNVRIAAASLAFNVAAANHRSRMEKDSDLLSNNDQIELVASILEALGREEESKEAVKGLVLALGLLVYCAPLEGELPDLCRAMEARSTVESKLALSGDDTILKEIAEELLGKGLE
jgi:thiol-disulfide isomerase/thioredoxin